MLLEAFPALVLPTDLTLLKRLIRESRTWALVDVLAGDVIGRLLIRQAVKYLDPDQRDELMNAYRKKRTAR
jgi:3-methyladenine DNA glycosylase AlkD